MKTIRMHLCFLLLSVSFFTYGQQIMEIQSELGRMNISSDPSLKTAAADLAGLAFENKPTLYYSGGSVIAASVPDPIRVVTDVASFSLLTNMEPLFANVQIICINISDPGELTAQLDLSRLIGFSKLQYIYFICSFKICGQELDAVSCEQQKILRMLSGTRQQNIKVLYTSQNED